MFWGDGSANLSANALPEMVLPMSLQLGLRDAGRNESQADNRLLIPHFCSVNPGASSQRRRRKPLYCHAAQGAAQILMSRRETHGVRARQCARRPRRNSYLGSLIRDGQLLVQGTSQRNFLYRTCHILVQICVARVENQ